MASQAGEKSQTSVIFAVPATASRRDLGSGGTRGAGRRFWRQLSALDISLPESLSPLRSRSRSRSRSRFDPSQSSPSARERRLSRSSLSRHLPRPRPLPRTRPIHRTRHVPFLSPFTCSRSRYPSRSRSCSRSSRLYRSRSRSPCLCPSCSRFSSGCLLSPCSSPYPLNSLQSDTRDLHDLTHSIAYFLVHLPLDRAR